MNILSVENLEKTVKDEPLFSGLTFGLEKGEKVGIVGKNGAGKSTLLKVLAGLIVPDEGNISIKNGMDISLLEQNVSFKEEDSVEDYFFSSISSKIQKLGKYYSSLKNENAKNQMRLYEEVEKIVGAISPVPGGVGLVTSAVLIKHVIAAAERRGQ